MFGDWRFRYLGSGFGGWSSTRRGMAARAFARRPVLGGGGVQGLEVRRFGVHGLGVRVQGLGLRVLGWGISVQSFKCRIHSQRLGCRILGSYHALVRVDRRDLVPDAQLQPLQAFHLCAGTKQPFICGNGTRCYMTAFRWTNDRLIALSAH